MQKGSKIDAKGIQTGQSNASKTSESDQREAKGHAKGPRSRPSGAKGASKTASTSLHLANLPPMSPLERPWASFCFILEGF